MNEQLLYISHSGNKITRQRKETKSIFYFKFTNEIDSVDLPFLIVHVFCLVSFGLHSVGCSDNKAEISTLCHSIYLSTPLFPLFSFLTAGWDCSSPICR